MYLHLVIIFLTVRYLRKRSVTAVNYPELDRLLLGSLVAAVVLFVLEATNDLSVHVVMWFVYAILYGLGFLVYKKQAFAYAKPIFYSLLPYVVVAFIKDVAELLNHSFYKSWQNYFETAKGFALLWALAMWFINRKQRKALEKERKKTEDIEKEIRISEQLKNALEVQVAERTAALTLQKEELQKTVDELKATQAQLIQAEKMASLGELTAGIAHEIQNPLNFVNNFAEVTNELIEEMNEELNRGDVEEAKAIAADIKQNLEKINHHGKRADSIVKGMLQHSRKSTGQKEPTELNALADEYLRLSYHGLRAKDKSFNATLHTSFDDSIGKINLMPQDFGRVLLNLFNNAFYATQERQKAGAHPPDATSGQALNGGEEYRPTITLSTKRISLPLGVGGVVITVADNGGGIPQKIVDKIFQPFFTTKPTGSGTGLGLSLSYDIVKAHGGDIKLETKEGEGTAFIITLPAA
jgi:two-component system, NtrC family, sensor kinase